LGPLGASHQDTRVPKRRSRRALFLSLVSGQGRPRQRRGGRWDMRCAWGRWAGGAPRSLALPMCWWNEFISSSAAGRGMPAAATCSGLTWSYSPTPGVTTALGCAGSILTPQPLGDTRNPHIPAQGGEEAWGYRAG